MYGPTWLKMLIQFLLDQSASLYYPFGQLTIFPDCIISCQQCDFSIRLSPYQDGNLHHDIWHNFHETENPLFV